jgi:hypothetical protein
MLQGVLLMARPFDRAMFGGTMFNRTVSGFRLRLRPFNGRCLGAGRFWKAFFRLRSSFTHGGCRRLTRRGGVGRTQAASTTATTTTSATGWAFPWSGLIRFRLMFIRHFQNKVGVPGGKSNKETLPKCKNSDNPVTRGAYFVKNVYTRSCNT